MEVYRILEKQKIREPKVKNKYNLKPSYITSAIVLDKNAFKSKPFWRNNVVSAYCISETTISCKADSEFGTYNDYWIGFYDDDAPEHAGEIILHCSCYGGMCHYNFSEFFNPDEMNNNLDVLIQEKLLTMYHWLIDNKIVKFTKGENFENE